MLFAAVRRALMALSGQSLRRNSLSAFGPKRTMGDLGIGTVCPLMTHKRQCRTELLHCR